MVFVGVSVLLVLVFVLVPTRPPQRALRTGAGPAAPRGRPSRHVYAGELDGWEGAPNHRLAAGHCIRESQSHQCVWPHVLCAWCPTRLRGGAGPCVFDVPVWLRQPPLPPGSLLCFVHWMRSGPANPTIEFVEDFCSCSPFLFFRSCFAKCVLRCGWAFFSARSDLHRRGGAVGPAAHLPNHGPSPKDSGHPTGPAAAGGAATGAAGCRCRCCRRGWRWCY